MTSKEDKELRKEFRKNRVSRKEFRRLQLDYGCCQCCDLASREHCGVCGWYQNVFQFEGAKAKKRLQKSM